MKRMRANKGLKMQDLLYSEWLVLKALQDKTMTLSELNQSTGLDKGLLIEVLSTLIKMKRVHATRGIFRAKIKIDDPPRFNNFGKSMVKMINETYRISLKDWELTSA